VLLVWQILALHSSVLPDPAAVARTAAQAFMAPDHGGTGAATGIAPVLLTTLSRMTGALILAVCIGVPAGLLLGRSRWLGAMLMPIVNLLRHVSPLAWLPLGLLVFGSKTSVIVATVCICCVWPLLIQTAEGIRRVPANYLVVARTLALGERKTLRVIVLPCTLPFVVNGLRHAATTAWIVVVAAEMFVNDGGLGSWLRASLAEQNSRQIVMAIVLVGLIGLILDLPLVALRRRITRRLTL
jgi:nitrate/nitrite transport system permease protein